MQKKTLRTYTFNLIANQDNKIGVAGSGYFVIDNQSDFSIRFDESTVMNKATKGTGANFVSEYNEVTISSTVNQEVTIVLGYGDFKDARASINATISATIENSNSVLTYPDKVVTAVRTQLVAASNSRNEIEVGVPSDAVAAIRVGDSFTEANRGSRIEAGQTKFFTTSAAIFAISEGGDVDVSLMELRNV